jgi:hypothetical protein
VAAVGKRKLNNPNPLVDNFGIEGHPPAGAVTGQFTAAIVVGALCAPVSPISDSPIMPQGFITYTDLMPSSKL